MAGKVLHVIVDSGGFIRNAPVGEIGENVYTVDEVLREIRDKATRQRLQVLSYNLKIKDPSTDVLKIVTDFAKKTGDYRSLSAVDLKVIALVYQLEKEHVGTDHLKTQPDTKITWTTTNSTLDNPTAVAGFYLGKKATNASRSSSESQSNAADEATNRVCQIEISDEKDTDTTNTHVDEKDTDTTTSPVEENVERRTEEVEKCDTEEPVSEDHNQPKTAVGEGAVLPSSSLQEDDSESSGEEEESDSDDDEGWITPNNLAAAKESMGERRTERAQVPVACLTTDFAMQNVLIQMGLNVVSVDGLLIKRAKSFVLRCHACFKITTNMTKEFCQHCGNKTLQKVSMTVDDDGSIRYCLSRRKPISRRGLKYSLPTPRGGKHAKNPILCGDQKEAQQRSSNSGKVKYDVMDPDYLAHTSPFAPNDIYSKAGQLGIRAKHGQKRARNPNENKKVYGRRK